MRFLVRQSWVFVDNEENEDEKMEVVLWWKLKRYQHRDQVDWVRLLHNLQTKIGRLLWCFLMVVLLSVQKLFVQSLLSKKKEKKKKTF